MDGLASRTRLDTCVGRPAGVRMKPLSYWSFVQRYCRTRDNGFGIQIVGGKNLDQLKAAGIPMN